MVGITIQCRMGNQLFQYAFIKALSEKLDTSFFLNDKIEKIIASDYFHLEGYNPVLNPLKRIYFKLKRGNLFTHQNTVAIDAYSDTVLAGLSNQVIYGGYFQSELFFKNIADKISGYIRVKEKYKKEFNSLYKNTFSNNKVIAVHIRRGDYLNLGYWWTENMGSNNLTLPLDYYMNCLDQLKDKHNHKIIFVSDDIEFVRDNFGHIKNAEFASNSMIIDFQMIMNADVCILANSSFAWWAAYLNPKKSKLVFCPEYWLGFKIKREYPEHIIPESWKRVKV